MTQRLPPSEVKGLWFTVPKRYILENHGADALAMVITHMGERHGAIFDSALSSEWYEEETLRRLLAACHEVLARNHDDEYVHVVEETSLVAIHHFFRALLRLVPPAAMLRKIPTMWNIMRRGPGRVEVETSDQGGVVHYSSFPYFDDVLYRLMTKGAIRALMRLCGTPAEVVLGEHTRDSLNVEVRWR